MENPFFNTSQKYHKNYSFSCLSDEKLYSLCRKYGFQARSWRQKFIGLLPEVERRRLWEKKSFSSVFHFAKVLAGVSEEQVRLVLNLEKKFEDKPKLKQFLEKGEVSVNKLARIVSIATPENEEFLANQVQLLSNRALETLIRDEKYARNQREGIENRPENINHQNGFLKPNFDDKSLHVQTNSQQDQDNVKSELYLSDEVQRKLLELQNKGININEMILEFLKKREMEIAREKEEIAAEEKQKLEYLQEIWRSDRVKTSRYIRKDIRNIIRKEHGTKCSVPNCKKQATEIHHQNRFSMSQIHDPRFMVPFCEEHHQIAHSIDLKFHEKRSTGLAR